MMFMGSDEKSPELSRPRLASINVSLVFLLFTSLLVPAGPVMAHGEDGDEVPVSRVLGEINFPTSAELPEAQEAFIRGMLLLHLFEYPFAREEFLAAQELEPDFAMAYWGEAMTYNHPIWDEQDLTAARLVLLKLGATSEQRQAAAPTPREKAFLQAVDVLYGAGSKAERDRAYMMTLEAMATEYPDDHEIQLFYALSLFGVQAGVRDIPTYMLSTAIAQNVFSENPQHPGAAHYLIHGVDDPDHAVLGLKAARSLAQMAPDAGHSLHMTSHIFTALGMWDDVVSANEAAVAVQNEMRLSRGQPARHWGHYNFWLMYAYLQQGRVQTARELLTAAYLELQADDKLPEDRMMLDSDSYILGSVVQMWTRYLVETQDWNGEIADWQFKMGDVFDPNLNFTYVQGLRAADGGQASLSRSFLDQFLRLKADLAQAIRNLDEEAPGHALYLQRLDVLEQEMLAGIELARGEYLLAAQFARAGSDIEGEMPMSFGPPFVDWPAAEFEGQLLLKARRFADAAEAFELDLSRARLRTRSMLGLAKARDALGENALAMYQLQRLALIWRDADPDVVAQLEDLAITVSGQGVIETEDEVISDQAEEVEVEQGKTTTW